MNQTTKTKLREQYEQLKPLLQQRWPELQDSDLEKVKTDPDGFVDKVAKDTGEDKEQIKDQLDQVASSV